MLHRWNAFIAITLFAGAVFGQTSVTSSSSPAGFSGSAHFGASPPSGVRGVTGAPYSGEEESEDVQTLADGTHITRKSPSTKIYRDSLGRTRTERPLFRGAAMNGNVPDSPMVVEIVDPVAQVRYTLDTINRIAHRQQMPAAPEGGNRTAAVRAGILQQGPMTSNAGQVLPLPVPRPAPSDVKRPATARENLGTQSIEGVLAEGTRHTTTWPIGSQGNDRPISMVSEIWMSQELKVMILSKSSDPRSGEHTQKLTNISRAEPSASLFQPPPEYTVVDEAGDFTIKWGIQQ